MIKFLQNQDILKLKADAIINTVNCVGVMGKGIALQFKQKYQKNFNEYKTACDKGEIKTGEMFVHSLGFVEQPKFIINFPTKNHWKEKSKIEYIEQGLEDLVNVIKQHNIKSIVIPPLGCGNGGLSWDKVKDLIVKYLDNLDVDVLVTEPTNQFNEIKTTEKVALTPFRAVFIKLIQVYNDALYELGKIEIQKLIYFQNLIMGNSKLKYTKHKFGPYCHNLHNAIDNLSGHYITGVKDGTKQSQIRLIDGAEKEADDFIKKTDTSLFDTVEKLKNIITGYETPFGMELLGTVHWVVANENAKTLDEVVKKVHDWNERKKEIMSVKEIEIAYNHLKKCDLS